MSCGPSGARLGRTMTVQTRYFRERHTGLSDRAESLAAAARRLPSASPAQRDELEGVEVEAA